MPLKSHSNRNLTDPRLLAERGLLETGTVPRHAKIRRTVTVNLAESPLSWLHARGHLSDRQMLAGKPCAAIMKLPRSVRMSPCHGKMFRSGGKNALRRLV